MKSGIAEGVASDSHDPNLYYIDIFQFAEYRSSIPIFWNSIGQFEQKLSNFKNDNELQMLTMLKHESLIEKKIHLIGYSYGLMLSGNFLLTRF